MCHAECNDKKYHLGDREQKTACSQHHSKHLKPSIAVYHNDHLHPNTDLARINVRSLYQQVGFTELIPVILDWFASVYTHFKLEEIKS
jgi:hypothetical protein